MSLALLLALTVPAYAGDVGLYARALAYVDGFYLHPESVNRERMFEDAGRQAERSIEWLLVDINGPVLTLRDGSGDWRAEVKLDRPSALPDALSQLEDALRAAPHPLPTDLDLRVELLRGLTKSLDRHSVILADTNLTRFDERLSGTMTGVGANCAVNGGFLVVMEVLAGSPADLGGLKVGDRVLKVDGRSTIGMVASDVTRLLRGPVGSTVNVDIARPTSAPAESAVAGGAPDTLTPIAVTLERADVHIPNVFVDRDTGDVGVVRIDHFSEETHEWLYRSLAQIDKSPVSGLILDLRGNTGGSLLQSADAADAFLQHGHIVGTVGSDGHAVSGLTESFDAGPDNPPHALPMAVLVDHLTASGSEILSGSLQHLGRALVFGTNTFGKGTVQKIYPLADGIKFKLTVAEYRLADDARVVDVGIHPDVLFYPYRFDGDGVWFPDPDAELRYAPANTVILPLADELPGWRPGAVASHDSALDAAISLIAAAEGASREKLLNGLSLIAPSLEATFDQHLRDVFGARGMDWSPAPPLVADAPPVLLPVLASGQLRAEARRHATPSATMSPAEADGAAGVGDADLATVQAGTDVTLRVSVRNDGGPLWRARVRLHSLNGVWDDRVLPLGRVPAGTSRTGEAGLTVPITASPRADVVEMWLEADGIPSTKIGERVLSVDAEPPLELGATLRTKTDEAGRLTVDIALSDLGTDPEPRSRARGPHSLRLRFAWPDLDGVELNAPAQVSVDLPDRGTTHVGLALTLGTQAAATLPLDLVVDNTAGVEVARWPVTLPREDTVRVEPPTLAIRPLSNVQPPGMALLQLRTTDDDAVDHVLVYAGTERVDRTRYEPDTIWDARKVSWAGPPPNASARDRRKFDETVAVPVYPGENRYTVAVTDSTGLKTERVVYILGQPQDGAADADGG